MRRAVNNARSNGVPICSSRFGYFYSTNREHISKTISSIQGRIEAQTSAVNGLADALVRTGR